MFKRIVNVKWLIEAFKTFPAVLKRKQRKYLLDKPYFKIPFDQQGPALLANETGLWQVQVKHGDTEEITGMWFVDVTHDYSMRPENWYDGKIRIVRVSKDKFMLLNFPPIYYSSEAPAQLYLVIKSHIEHEGRSINLRPEVNGDL
jgi:hypothetical protein